MSFDMPADEILRDAVLDAVEALGRKAVPEIERRLGLERNPENRRRLWGAAQASGYTTGELKRLLRAEVGRSDLSGELRQTLLRAAIGLEVDGLQSFAEVSLDSDDTHVRLLGARYLASFAERGQSDRLVELFSEYTHPSADPLNAPWISKSALRALVRLSAQGDDGLKEVSQHIIGSLHRTGALDVVDAVLLVRDVEWWDPYPAILDALATALPDKEQSATVFHILNLLDELAEPVALEHLRNRARELSDAGVDVVELLKVAVLDQATKSTEDRLSEYLVQKAIRVMGLLELTSSGSFLAELLGKLEWPMDQAVADQLLILGVTEADEALATKLEQWRLNSNGRLSDERPLYASATCAGTTTAGWLLRFLAYATDQQIQTDVPHRVILPLLHQGVLSTEDLVSLALDPSASTSGRIASIATLSYFEPERHARVFLDLANEHDAGVAFDRYVIAALGLTRDQNVSSVIVKIANRWPDDDWLNAVAANSLSRLGASHRASWVAERFALFSTSHHIDTFASAWMDLDKDSVSTIVEAVTRLMQSWSLHPYFTSKLLVVAGQASKHEHVQSLLTSLLEPLDANKPWVAEFQDSAFSVLCQSDPQRAVDDALRLDARGMLTLDSQQELAGHLGGLVAELGAHSSLVQLTSRLASTSDARIRQLAAESFTDAPAPKARELLVSCLHNASDASKVGLVSSIAYVAGLRDLHTALLLDPSWSVRRAARRASHVAAKQRAVTEAISSVESNGRMNGKDWRVLTAWATERAVDRLWRMSDPLQVLAPTLYELGDVVKQRRRRELDALSKSGEKFHPNGGSTQVVSLG